MRLYVLLLALVLVSAYQVQDSIIHLEGSELEEITRIFPKILVFYYVPWCEHSIKLASVYEQLASVLEEEGSPIKIAKVNCEDNVEAYDFAQIRRLPLLKYYALNQEIEFDGDRTLTYLHKWLTKRVKFPITPTSQAQLQILRSLLTSEVYIVYYGSIQTARAAQFISMAYNDNHNHYLNVVEGLNQLEGTLQVLRSFEKDVIELVEPRETEEWIRKYDRPAVVPLDQRAINHVFRDGEKGVFLFIDALHTKVKEQLAKAAQKWKQRSNSTLKLTFLAIPEQHEDYFGLMEYLGLHALDQPLAVVDGKDDVKYILNCTITKINQEQIIKFLQNIEAGKIESEPLQSNSQTEQVLHQFLHMNDTKPGETSHQGQHSDFLPKEDNNINGGQSRKVLRREKSFTLTRQL